MLGLELKYTLILTKKKRIKVIIRTMNCNDKENTHTQSDADFVFAFLN